MEVFSIATKHLCLSGFYILHWLIVLFRFVYKLQSFEDPTRKKKYFEDPLIVYTCDLYLGLGLVMNLTFFLVIVDG
jgi:hypothetical protein